MRANKLLGKTNWFKGGKDKVKYDKGNRKSGKTYAKEEAQKEEVKAVLYCDFIKGRELVNSLRELMRRMERTLGFGIKVVERTGPTLRSQFPMGSLWEGTGCERTDCIICTQGAEMISNFTKSSILYENVCLTCNPGAKERRPLVERQERLLPYNEPSGTSPLPGGGA